LDEQKRGEIPREWKRKTQRSFFVFPLSRESMVIADNEVYNEQYRGTIVQSNSIQPTEIF
jgi:hypothetical protein